MFADYPLKIFDYLWLPSRPVLSGLIWLVLVVVILYVARLPVHRLIAVSFARLNRLLRLLVLFLQGVNSRLRQRNRDVLLARGRENIERKLEKDFVQIADQVSRDLCDWPSVHREMREQITHMEGEREKSAEVPPQPPEWLQVVDAVAKVSAKVSARGSAVIAKILADIQVTLQQATDKSVAEYRQANRDRYALLNNMVPQWHGLNNSLDDLDKKISRLNQFTQRIDAHMQTYQQILQGTDQAVKALTRSAATGLLFSLFLLLIATAGGIVNFQLLALPLAEVVGVHSDILGVRSSDVAAAAVIFMQIILGLFLLEAAGVTRLLPDIAMLEKRKRRRVMYLMLLILLVMAAMESLLIYTRDALAADYVSLNQLLAAPAEAQQVSMSWIPALGQVVMGFLLPLLLVFSVIAFETFIYALRTVAGMFLSWLLEVLMLLVRLLAALLRMAGSILIALYDVVIFLPLYIERLMRYQRLSKPAAEKIVMPESDV